MQPDINYLLTFRDGRRVELPIRLDPHGEIICDDDFVPPAWAMLGHHQCSHCPLEPDEVTHCPVARNMAWVFAGRDTGPSHEPVSLRVQVGHRAHVFDDTTVQRALSSLFGLICALSPCPHTLPLRPMGIFHLPLATDVETLMRISSLFLLRSYLAHLDNPALPVDLTDMGITYQALGTLNQGIAARMRTASTSDAAVNAITLLDVLVKDVRFELDSQLALLKQMMNA